MMIVIRDALVSLFCNEMWVSSDELKITKQKNIMKIEIKNIGGEGIYSHEEEGNTLKITLEKAVSEDANLVNANLRVANLEYAILEIANLWGANLWGANLEGADLWRANLEGANLESANLWRAILESANLRVANLESANLESANLEYANLRGANLRYTNLEGANLRGANLEGANLRGANLESANLESANLEYVNLMNANFKNAIFDEDALWVKQTRVAIEGDLIGYKKCKDGEIVKLLIPKEAKRSNAFGRKCRAEFAKVLEISRGDVAYSKYDNIFEYRVGEIVRPTKPFSEDWKDECASGIHFFVTREEAENY